MHTINNECFRQLQQDNSLHYRIWAHHKSKDSNQCSKHAQEKYSHYASIEGGKDKTFGRPSGCPHAYNYLDLAIGSRVQLTDNLATELGLYNGYKLYYSYTFLFIRNQHALSKLQQTGALGTIRGFGWEDGIVQDPPIPVSSTDNMYNQPPILFVQMDHYKGTSLSPTIPNLVSFVFKKRTLADTYSRWQYPLAISHCRTVHSIQGLTAKQGAIVYPTPSGPPFCRGSEYVACSRPTRTEDLWLMGPLYLEHFNSRKHSTSIQNINNFYSQLRLKPCFITLQNYTHAIHSALTTMEFES